jgi:hypothetical protein
MSLVVFLCWGFVCACAVNRIGVSVFVVSGATARFDIVNFPPTSDDYLVNGLRYAVVDERNKDNVALLDLPFVAASGEVERLLETSQLPANQQLVLSSHGDCVFVVDHLGSHFGDLQVALKHIVEGASAQGNNTLCALSGSLLFYFLLFHQRAAFETLFLTLFVILHRFPLLLLLFFLVFCRSPVLACFRVFLPPLCFLPLTACCWCLFLLSFLTLRHSSCFNH